MLRLVRAAPLVLAALASGCFLDRSAIDDPRGIDAARLDGGEPDGGVIARDASPDSGPCTPSPELCNGLDDDCDGTTADDGADEETLGAPCDHPGDADLCEDGAVVCVGGALVCNDDGNQPDEIERCDGVDNDCNPATPDGAGEPGIGEPCDGDDLDLCAGGTLVCTGAGLECTDDGDLPDEVERCDGVDNDCNPATPDGAGEPWFESACDDPADLDLCAGGTDTCASGVRTCAGDDGDLPSEVERCDGVDNDCNPATPDGAAESWVGMPCDDPGDADLCPEGALACSGGGMVCSGDDGDQPGEVERCDGIDNDCNPATPDGAAEIGAACDGPDGDMCREGMATACTGGVLACDDTTGTSTESCNGEDDDCDGTVDEGTSCGCTRRTRGGRSYLFCERSRVWTTARDECRSMGYQLVSIGDEPEQIFVRNEAHAVNSGSWWIGANDRGTEGAWVWSGDGPVTFSAWRSGEPNNSGFLGIEEDCAELQTGETSATGVAGGWNDAACGAFRNFVCESGPAITP